MFAESSKVDHIVRINVVRAAITFFPSGSRRDLLIFRIRDFLLLLNRRVEFYDPHLRARIEYDRRNDEPVHSSLIDFSSVVCRNTDER